ncbi:MAG: Crp/Fnr family transcriptional regulator [Chromatiaceae bacterium]|nr:Crp/Fnr family transcriptional regulator [Chromatiaceae bacterium]MCP5423367.1 Crp/Fnr family transcriptional regulator [Chromatiaceae bacterium]
MAAERSRSACRRHADDATVELRGEDRVPRHNSALPHPTKVDKGTQHVSFAGTRLFEANRKTMHATPAIANVARCSGIPDHSPAHPLHGNAVGGSALAPDASTHHEAHPRKVAMSLLQDVPLFSGLSADDLAALEARFVRKTYRRRTVVIEKGDENANLFVVASGQVRVYIADSGGREIILNELGEGDYFGELALLGDQPRSASVVTLTETTCLTIAKQTFREFLSEYPDVAFNLIRDLAQKVFQLSDDVANLALRDVYQRVRDVLVKLAQPSAEQPEIALIEHITQQDVASRVGASREMVSRIFRDLKRGDYIRLDGKTLILQKTLPDHW